VGEQRVKAILQVNASGVQPPLKVRCTIRDLDEAAAFALSVAENDARNKPSTADHAYAVKTLIEEYGKTQAEVAAIYGASQSWVSNILSISTLPVAALKRIHNGEITYDAAVLLAGLDKTTQKFVLGSAGEVEGKLDLEAVQNALDVLSGEIEGTPFTKRDGGLPGEEYEAATSLKTEQEELLVTDNSEAEQVEEAEAEAVVPKSAKKRGRPRMTKTQKAEKKAKKPLSLKAVRAFFEDQAKPAEGEEASVWNELCGGFGEWMDHRFGDRAMIGRGKTACGLDG
jgi:ParB-like chromosome segregation protein Spo0J